MCETSPFSISDQGVDADADADADATVRRWQCPARSVVVGNNGGLKSQDTVLGQVGRPKDESPLDRAIVDESLGEVNS